MKDGRRPELKDTCSDTENDQSVIKKTKKRFDFGRVVLPLIV